MQELIEKIEALKSKEDFVAFVQLLMEDLKHNGNEWENNTLESYLGAIAAWTEDMNGYYKNMNLPIPENVDWKVFANILIAATMYE